MGNSVISCSPISNEISQAITRIYSQEFQNEVQNSVNPYGFPGASKKIIEVISQISLDSLVVAASLSPATAAAGPRNCNCPTRIIASVRIPNQSQSIYATIG